MLGAIGDMERYPAIGLDYFGIFDNSKTAIHRANPAGEHSKDAHIKREMPSDNAPQREEQTTTKNVFEDRKLVIERYDRDGKLIRMTPPGYLPFDQIGHSIMV